MFFVSYMRGSAKFFILNKEIIEKISYERRAYESVDERSMYLRLCPERRRKKEIMYLRVKHLIIGFSTEWLSFLCFPHQITRFGIKKYLKIEWQSNRKDPEIVQTLSFFAR